MENRKKKSSSAVYFQCWTVYIQVACQCIGKGIFTLGIYTHRNLHRTVLS